MITTYLSLRRVAECGLNHLKLQREIEKKRYVVLKHDVMDRNCGTQDMRLYASVDDGCADCWRRASGACVWGIQWP